MTTQTEALKLARDLLKKLDKDLVIETWQLAKTLGAIDEALAQPSVSVEQEPVTCTSLCVECTKRGDWVCAKAIAPQRSEARASKPLTDEQKMAELLGTDLETYRRFTEWRAEHGIKEKNT